MRRLRIPIRVNRFPIVCRASLRPRSDHDYSDHDAHCFAIKEALFPASLERPLTSINTSAANIRECEKKYN